MSDDTTQRGPQDSSRVSTSEEYEVRYWTERFGVSHEQLQAAVDAVGNGAETIERHLKG